MPKPLLPGQSKALNRRQADFVRHFVANGGRGKAAASEAGYKPDYAAIEACRQLRKPEIISAIRDESERCLKANVAIGQKVIAELAERATSETVRLAAAQALLDRGGMQLIKRTEQTVTLQDNRTDAELLDTARRLARDLGFDAITIDGAGLIAEPIGVPSPIGRQGGGGPAFSSAIAHEGIKSPAAKFLEGAATPSQHHQHDDQ